MYLYVNDLLVIGRDVQPLQQFLNNMKNEFRISNLGEMKYFLGLEINQFDFGIFIS